MRPRLAASIVVLVAVVVWLPSVRNGFAYDDHVVIRLNDRLHDLSRAHLIFAQSYWPDASLGLYRPIASLSYAVDWAISGGQPLWFHIMNVVWNAAASLLVFALLLAFVPATAALIGALIFAVHPVHVEAVANIVGRAELMAAAFSIAALLLWLDARTATLSARRITAVAACYALSMMSKESAVMLPALIALADAARGTLRPDNLLAWLRTHARSFIVLAATGVAFIVARTLVLQELGPQRVDPTLDVASAFDDRVRTALQAWPHIIRLLVYPRTLLSDYGPRIIMPALSLNLLSLIGGVILVTLVAGGIWAWLRGRGRIAFVLLFLPVALLPVSNLIIPIGVLVAERALYLPSLAAAAAAAFAAAHFAADRRTRAATLAVALVVVALFTARTIDRIPTWRSTQTVFDALIRDRPDSFRANWHAARAAANRNDTAAALQHYANTLNLWPYRHNVVIEAASYAANNGDLPFARTITDFALQRWPEDVDALRLRAAIALDLADTTTARQLVQRGLSRAPGDTVLLRMRAAIQEPLP